MNLPPRGDLEAEGHAGDDFLYFKGASSFHLELFGAIHVEIGSLEPDPVSDFPGSELRGDLFLHLLLGNLVGCLGVIVSSRQFHKSTFQVG